MVFCRFNNFILFPDSHKAIFLFHVFLVQAMAPVNHFCNQIIVVLIHFQKLLISILLVIGVFQILEGYLSVVGLIKGFLVR